MYVAIYKEGGEKFFEELKNVKEAGRCFAKS
jgi:hypothetical protein